MFKVVMMFVAGSFGSFAPAHAAPVEMVDVVLFAAPAAEAAPAPVTVNEGCDSWCEWVREAYGVAAAGNMSDVIYAAAHGNRVPEMAAWGLATATCESGLNPNAWSGYYEGLFQHSPDYWPARAEAAGFAGASTFDPVANAFVTMWMISAGYPTSHWPNC